MSMKLSMKLKDECILKDGFLTKSPPLEKAYKRWRRRFFILYDPNHTSSDTASDVSSQIIRSNSTTHQLDEPTTRRNLVFKRRSSKSMMDVTPTKLVLVYYENEEKKNKGGMPINQLDLTNARVENCTSTSNYSYVIGLQTTERRMLLCAETKTEHESWLKQLQAVTEQKNWRVSALNMEKEDYNNNDQQQQESRLFTARYSQIIERETKICQQQSLDDKDITTNTTTKVQTTSTDENSLYLPVEKFNLQADSIDGYVVSQKHFPEIKKKTLNHEVFIKNKELSDEDYLTLSEPIEDEYNSELILTEAHKEETHVTVSSPPPIPQRSPCNKSLTKKHSFINKTFFDASFDEIIERDIKEDGDGYISSNVALNSNEKLSMDEETPTTVSSPPPVPQRPPRSKSLIKKHSFINKTYFDASFDEIIERDIKEDDDGYISSNVALNTNEEISMDDPDERYITMYPVGMDEPKKLERDVSRVFRKIKRM